MRIIGLLVLILELISLVITLKQELERHNISTRRFNNKLKPIFKRLRGRFK